MEPGHAEESSTSLPSLNLNGVSMQSPLKHPQHALTPPRLKQNIKRSSRRHLRPSTAPAEETTVLLPSVPSGVSIIESRTSSGSGFARDIGNMALNGKDIEGAIMQEKLDGKYPSMSKRDERHGPDLGVLPSPFIGDESSLQSRDGDFPREHVLSASTTGDLRSDITESDYDWATFISAYASGRWNPQRTPNPPRSYLFSPAHLMYLNSDPSSLPTSGRLDTPAIDDELLTSHSADSSPRILGPVTPRGHVLTPSSLGSESELDSTFLPDCLISTSIPPMYPPTTTSYNNPRAKSNPTLKLPSHRVRNSFADIRSTHCPSLSLDSDLARATPSTTPELTAAAATMRWAAASVNLAPLALPSPERELTDPFRGVTTPIPGSHNDISPELMTPGGGRKTRLATFWQGTQDIEDDGGRSASPAESPMAITRLEKVDESPELLDSLEVPPRFIVPLSASVPALHVPNTPTGDYFGDMEDEFPLKEKPSIVHRGSSPLEMGIASVPALPRRVCLTRQTSSPLPVSTKRELSLPGGRVASESISSVKAGRAAKEEQMFAELGFLAPPNPPEELERRRALYKFNIWNTGPDLNFDRIAHLAKLVFSTKCVMISLIDGNEQWFKSAWGMQSSCCARMHSFCAHAILQPADEPTVVLDTLLDWRFSKNPLVTGPPNIRFYAGAPLRTQDGFNIGSLAVIDDSPRQDFSPRQRHTLKEFAAIAMREMELWSDKIQLRIRDRIQNSMEQFSRECLEIDTEVQNKDRPDIFTGTSMDKVYDRAAKLVKRTLDVEGVIVMDVSHCEVLETMAGEGSVSVVMHYGDPQIETTTRALSIEEYSKLNAFFAKYPDGKISEGIVPLSFRPFLPTHIQYALTVPIFNVDKRPFALLCAYNASDETKRFLEGHELSYLRAIGVIILSAVLKRRMLLADKAKSLFISNISHELRTPLHGILAAAELLTDSPLNHSQISFLQTVQACGTSLVETVNHVLDFTKLSGNSKAGGVENVIVPSKVDLMHLVEEAVDGCWIGHRARTSVIRESEIGSVYAPPKADRRSATSPTKRRLVETVVDIGRREGGWVLKCEKGGIRRVLMNLFGNSLKFCSDGFVHVALRQLPPTDDIPPHEIKIELSVVDTGKGISQNFLKNQLFHPFSQENPLQTGTGLGLAIVNSIVQSESVGGKVDVWSEEGEGTEIKVTFTAESVQDSGEFDYGSMKFDDPSKPPTVSLVGFDLEHKGVRLLYDVLTSYLSSWWGFQIHPEGDCYGDIVIVNDDPTPVVTATTAKDTSRPFIVLSASRGSPKIMTIASDHERIGGFCRIIYKPGGPSRLCSVLKLCLHALKISTHSHSSSAVGTTKSAECIRDSSTPEIEDGFASLVTIPRRHSEGRSWPPIQSHRPAMFPRSSTALPISSGWNTLASTLENDENPVSSSNANSGQSPTPTISIGSGGTLLKSSVGTINSSERRFRILVVEDNSILRNLLVRWLTSKGYDFRDAEDGRQSVDVFEQEGPFDIVLLDMSMPVLDGVGATIEIRRIESARAKQEANRATRILALTGMSSLEDKRRAFDAGVDGYLVKPVAFKTLDEMFHTLGMS